MGVNSVFIFSSLENEGVSKPIFTVKLFNQPVGGAQERGQQEGIGCPHGCPLLGIGVGVFRPFDVGFTTQHLL